MAYSHVLITRPEPEAKQLAMMLDGSGIIPVLIPAFRFEAMHPGFDFRQVWRHGRRVAIFCSPRSVTYGLRQLPAGFLDDVEVAAIGPSTLRQLEDAGHAARIVPAPPYNSESLLENPALNESPGQALLFTAPNGRTLLFDGLGERGWDVSYAHVYRSIEQAVTDQASVESDPGKRWLSVWTSANAMDHLAASLPGTLWDQVRAGDFLVTSQRLADRAGEYCRGSILLTDGPGNREIFQTIERIQAS